MMDRHDSYEDRSADGDDHENDDAEDDSGNAMMSIFASYYGIEETAQAKRPPADLIDSAHFDSNAFVKELLTTLPVEKLVSKDTSMVHEIRALDGDMQMLVYENYNKFISATETIKRMKNNVDAMDGDMEAVRVKMNRISKTAHSIDDTMADNRSKVDKLVRVRRLLSRLEFLSELPEKLSEMILTENYKDAVQLYSKTITVLTAHSHVLSFKNIKERIEKMMQDLRGRVMDLLDDPSLEAVKLTQHVAVLQLMEAPRDKVVGKLLTAHKRRSLRMTKLYLQQLSNTPSTPSSSSSSSFSSSTPSKSKISTINRTPSKNSALSPSSNSTSTSARADVTPNNATFTLDSSSDVVGSVPCARMFHQFLVVGLIEACKGIQELFPDVLGPGRGNGYVSGTGSFTSNTGGTGSGNGSSSSSSSSSSSVAEAVLSAAEAHTQLQACLSSVMLEYTKCLADSLKLFYVRLEEHSKLCQVHEDQVIKNKSNKKSTKSNLEDDRNSLSLTITDTQNVGAGVNDENIRMSVQAARTAQLRTYELAEEKQAWMLLIRQAILDCQFLDAAAEDCKVPASMLTQTPSTPRSLSLHSIAFATAILGILDGQHLSTLNSSVDALALSVTSLCATDMAMLCDMRTDHLLNADSNPFGARTTSTPGITRSRENSHNSLVSIKDTRSICLYPDAYSSRTAVQQRTVLLKHLQDRACEMFITCFSDICADYRPIVEIHGVAMLRGRSKDEEVCYSTLLLRKFVESVCLAFEKTVRVSASGFFGRSSLDNFYKDENPFKREDVFKDVKNSSIKVVIHNNSNPGKAAISEKGNTVNSAIDNADDRVRVLEFVCLALSGIFKSIAVSLLKRVNMEFMTHELDTVHDHALERHCGHRLECTSSALLATFCENNSNHLAQLLSLALFKKSSHLKTSEGEGEDNKKSEHSGLMDFSIRLDSLAVACCIVLGETPPTAKMSVGSLDRDFSRRALTQKNGNNARAGLQLDIERLFAQQIRIFDPESLISPTLDSVVGTALKASFKSSQENCRLLIFSTQMLSTLQAKVTIVKQMGSAVLHDSSGCDALADQVLSSLQNRHSEDFHPKNEEGAEWDEVAVLSKMVSECVESVGRSTALLPKQ